MEEQRRYRPYPSELSGLSRWEIIGVRVGCAIVLLHFLAFGYAVWEVIGLFGEVVTR